MLRSRRQVEELKNQVNELYNHIADFDRRIARLETVGNSNANQIRNIEAKLDELEDRNTNTSQTLGVRIKRFLAGVITAIIVAAIFFLPPYFLSSFNGFNFASSAAMGGITAALITLFFNPILSDIDNKYDSRLSQVSTNVGAIITAILALLLSVSSESVKVSMVAVLISALATSIVLIGVYIMHWTSKRNASI